MIAQLAALWERPERLCVGLMSGTSMDGIDAALVRVTGAGAQTRVDLREFLCHPFEAELHRRLTRLAGGDVATALEWARLDHHIAQAFAQAALAVMQSAGVAPEQVDFIASHGQTLAHHAAGNSAWDPLATTWQAGNANVIAALTGILVVADFRSADVALGGTGAPLVPYVDWLLRRSPTEDRIILNVGGIANLTWLPAGGSLEATRAWDCGPGNMVVDALAQTLLRQPCDTNGTVAASGTPDSDWVEELLGADWFVASPPKAAGREQFGVAFVQGFRQEAKRRQLAVADQLATALELTVQSVAQALAALPIRKTQSVVYVTGGGRHNDALMQRLRAALPCRVEGLDILGVDIEAKEAVDFAVLGHEAILGHATNLPQVTGALRPCILGSLALAGCTPTDRRVAHQEGT